MQVKFKQILRKIHIKMYSGISTSSTYIIKNDYKKIYNLKLNVLIVVDI